MARVSPIAIGLLVAVAACDSSSEPGDDGAASDARYAVITRVANADYTSATSYVTTVDSFAAGRKLDLSKALEVEGGSDLSRGAEPGTFFVRQLPLVKKYEAGPGGKLVEKSAMSFAAEGAVERLFDSSFIHVVSSKKAYLFNEPTASVVVWSPEEMAITGRFSLGIGDEGMPLHFGVNAEERGGRLFFTAYFSDMVKETVSPISYTFSIDTTTDELVTRRELRCGGLATVVKAANDNVYAFPDVWSASIHRIDPARAGKSCFVRFRPGDTAPDPDFVQDLDTLAGGRVAAGALPATGNEIYLFVLDEAKAAISPSMTALTLHAAPAWQWVRVNVEGGGTPRSIDLFGGTQFWWTLEGHVYTYSMAEGGGDRTILHASVAGDPERGIVVPGEPRRAIALR